MEHQEKARSVLVSGIVNRQMMCGSFRLFMKEKTTQKTVYGWCFYQYTRYRNLDPLLSIHINIY